MKKKRKIRRRETNKIRTIGIIGTRKRDEDEDLEKVKEAFLQTYREGDRICSGKCPKGGDRFACILADVYTPNIHPLWFPAKWDKHGIAAGFIRNTNIAKYSDILIACISEDRTGGTEDTIKKFVKEHGEQNLILV